ncbi:PREDICTED: ras-specific guanine nucleotide-releasing factor RalGPS1 isoform X1 [Rhagoletis zephyria]|uniref:ras-specific guanine nucleotide-releasing factor RalGPS1 isoform X1 n=1 Tax=Rhagoletis zephyria TaxID=28612 RepID=UPI0008113EDD|nr:PREDICTED: ras-specific guanine nucleotide-releasing factor RalGPS1 isoform X1 [Rhagoletis zephyria]XP_017476986.1 PREDICTED: ras-specific guanine nucleotide-releasing factor RalGPS1 isoform X1 [Rhagoletis zephyria]XP_017476987.1 PREDICTED: ras-specific guanine nucleotide-releasing factor RalGPS1 isoform X1 [Rhagoletis zephyria]XP_017476988.1 PREDICTED: ras-specific guanine nucleotide-releasing factor RalGPS1 isoform X1 [Rhagoletis zephyria]
MMRYSEISRELSSDSLRYVELGDEYIYKNLREDSPRSDTQSNGSNGYMAPPTLISNNHHQHLTQQQQQQQSHAQQFQQQQQQQQQQEHSRNNYTNSMSNCGQQHSANNIRNSKRYSCGRDRSHDGASTISYMRPRKDSTRSTQSCQFDAEQLTQAIASKTMHVKSSRRKNSIGCLNSLSSSPGSPGCYYCVGSAPPPGKSQSLPARSSMNNLDAVILNALRVPADELANQITLLDFPIFAAIQPDELTSCAWTKKDKHVVTPNIVAFTKRFNHTSFWTVQEILSGEQPKQRAEILTHFIKVSKKLHELNNLHSLFAIISAMQSASIFRLKKTWACLSKKDRQAFERLSDIFSDQNNWENLRAYLESLRLPCIPYLGLFLTDLIYIDLAHPHKGGLEPEQRRNKMNNILRVIANYQQSNYTHILPIEATQKYLTSIRYIEELQNIFEEDQYKKSLKLEPASPSGPSSSSCSSKESFNVDAVTPALACLNLSPAKTIGSMRIANSSGSKFIPGHRKCRSLGTNIFGKITHSHNDSNNYGNPSTMMLGYGDEHHLHDYSILSQQQQARHPLDDSVLEHSSNMLSSGDATSNDSVEGVLCHNSDLEQIYAPSLDLDRCVQGCVRRKTVQKEGRKPAVASWQRYWLQIWANSLVYFPPKSFKGSERSDFKREPCKVCPLEGWFAQVVDNTKHKNSFELYHRTIGTIYKFRTDSAQATQLWTNSICKVAMQRSVPKPLPINLMSFE